MIVTTTNTLGDQDIVETLGMVQASTTWRRRILKTYHGGIRSVQPNGTLDFDIALGEIKKEAMTKMMKSATESGASAVVGMNEQITEVTSGVFMVTVMGTAVRCQPKQPTASEFSLIGDNINDLFHLYEHPAMATAGGSDYCH